MRKKRYSHMLVTTCVSVVVFAVISVCCRGNEGEDKLAFGSLVKPEFREKVRQIAKELDVDANSLMTVMAIETSRPKGDGVEYTFDPAIQNPGSSAVGLIQFTKKTAEGLGTTTDAIKKMSAVEQLEYVKKYLATYKGRMKNVEDAYFAVFYPAAIGKSDDFVLPDSVYGPNKGLDKNSDGKLSRGEIAEFVKKTLERGRKRAD